MKYAGTVFILSALLWLGIPPAGACCFYNHSPIYLEVDGPHVNTDISPSDHHCTDGTGGTFSIVLRDLSTVQVSSSIYISVPNHGWLSIYGKKDGRWKVTVKDSYGNVIDTEYLQPYE